MGGALLVLEPVGGIAGDMFLAAALDLGVDRAALEAALRTLRLPGWRLQVERRTVGGISATHVDVVVEAGAPHGHRSVGDLQAVIEGSGLSPRARAAALDVLLRIGRAEARIHGVALEEVHLHEVGAVDSIVDVCGAAVALELLGWPRVLSSPPELGEGWVETAHGRLPVPPPAVLELLTGVPLRPGGPPGEAVTPTGAALLAAFAEVGPLPVIRPLRVGYGAGTATWPDRPNVLRATLAAEAAPEAAAAGQVWVLECNLDDAPGQLVARAIEAALEAGALDAWAAPITMKKGRPAFLLSALVEERVRREVTDALLAETTTLGVRRHAVERDVLERRVDTVQTPYGPVRVKVGLRAGRALGAHPEYDDCLARARERGVAVREVMAAAMAAHREGG